MSSPEISQVLAQMRAMQTQATGSAAAGAVESSPVAGNGFAQLLDDSINKVNDMQHEAGQLKTAFERGAEDVDLARVMIATQKASVSFTAMVEVRNKLVDAYKDVMNMPL